MNKIELSGIDIFLFTLFHHDLSFTDGTMKFDVSHLYELSIKKTADVSIKQLADTLSGIVLRNIEGLSDRDISLTLTGGMDSRLILACLLKAGVKPNCMTYGNPKSKDIIFAQNIAKYFGLKFHNACSEAPTKEWYYKWVIETIKRDQGKSYLHRAHRTAAMAEHNEIFSPKVLFTGHMGGEGLRGLTYNNYYSSSFYEMVNERKKPKENAIHDVLESYFLSGYKQEIKAINDRINQLSWMKYDSETNKLFYLYDLVGKIHHAQDIRLYKTFVNNVIPVYLQTDYLGELFSSQYHFLKKPKGIMGRLSNPNAHCLLIEQIFPALLDYPLSNGYSPGEYMKGLMYYIPVKLYRKYTRRAKYPSSFSYGKWYVDFVRENSNNICTEIWDLYNKEKYMDTLKKELHGSDEGYWHKFSNPIYFDLLTKHKHGVLS